ncbi:MAG: phospholipase [Bacteroidetes bacterium]|jgi:predicted esterase|nr:phospholipase [Bacteroidota bacterium]MDF1864086.1 hypothetical protein [Saprospiraceae bacterium]
MPNLRKAENQTKQFLFFSHFCHMQAHTIKVSKTAHYYTVGAPSKKIKQLWIAAHGYGQLAKKFIYKFEDFDDGETLVIAPDGLSRFYFVSKAGRNPGSCWMTREDRLVEIEDYTTYLQTIYEQFVPQLHDEVQIILFGFSQGCATVCRWMMAKFPRFDHLVLWGGFMPEDIDYLPHLDYVQSKNPHFIYGDEDQFLTEERMKWYDDIIEKQKIQLKRTVFGGKHIVDRKELMKLKLTLNV